MPEQEVTFASAGVRLSGTLTVSAGSDRRPCVVLLGGSGQVDRDENLGRLPYNVMGQLAGHLAGRGIGSLRYDKRGVGASQGDFWRTGFFDNVADAAAALAFVRGHERVQADKVFLLGHSEGAYIAVRVGAGSPGLAGLVLLAGGARRGEDEVRWQSEQMTRSAAGVDAWLLRLMRAMRVDVEGIQKRQLEGQLDVVKRSRGDWYRTRLFEQVNAKCLREFLAYDPAQDLGRIRVPVLAITGAKDIQVDPGNLERMAALVSAPFESHVLPDITHVLRGEPGPGGVSTYKAQARRGIDPHVPALIVRWLERQIGAVTAVGSTQGPPAP